MSSGPNNAKSREKWRTFVRGVQGLRLLFLVSLSGVGKVDQSVVEEHGKYKDILQSTLPDGHRKLGYKILTGYVWAALNCPNVGAVGKTDDNAELDIKGLMERLEESGKLMNEIACGSGTPHRNMKTLRSSTPHMTGNWSTSKEELEDDIMPDFCCGFLYLTSPTVGASLVQTALALYKNEEVVQIEDSLITGVLREKLKGVSIGTLENGIMNSLWQRLFSYCPWMTITKLTFFNSLVKRKRSSRSNVEYVGPITSIGLWRYYICLHLEVGLDQLEQKLPGLIPSFIWNTCRR